MLLRLCVRLCISFILLFYLLRENKSLSKPPWIEYCIAWNADIISYPISLAPFIIVGFSDPENARLKRSFTPLIGSAFSIFVPSSNEDVPIDTTFNAPEVNARLSVFPSELTFSPVTAA